MITRVFASFGRLLRPTVIGLLIFAVVQVCWWMWDQSTYARHVMTGAQMQYSDDLAAARRMAVLGVSVDEIRGFYPHIVESPGGLIIAPAALTKLEEDRRSHVVQYVSESGFFLVVLAACIGILWRGLHEENEVRQQQTNFLALVSHQFKTPLASLRLSVETLVKRQPSPEYAQQLSRRMLDDLGRLEGMVTKILDSARLNRGHVTFNDTRMELAGAVDHVISRLGDTAQKYHVAFDVHIPAGTMIYADPLAVENVLRNLLENAVTATAAQSGGNVTVTAQTEGDHVHVAVADTGIGFTAEDAQKLFGKFQRIESQPSLSSTSTGLGLFIVRRIMHFEHGRVTAASRGPGQGATFTVTWRRAADADGAQA